MLLQQPRVSRVNRCAAQQLDESRLGCDRLIDVPAGIGLPFHVADLDLRVSTTGRSRRTSATGQERLVLSPVGDNPAGHLSGQFFGLAGRLLQVNIQPDVLRHHRQGLIERRHSHTRKPLVFPAAGVEFLEFRERQARDSPLAVGRAIDRRIVDQHQLTVSRKRHVELDHLCSQANRLTKRLDRVLWMRVTGPTMGADPAVGHGHRTLSRPTRGCRQQSRAAEHRQSHAVGNPPSTGHDKLLNSWHLWSRNRSPVRPHRLMLASRNFARQHIHDPGSIVSRRSPCGSL